MNANLKNISVNSRSLAVKKCQIFTLTIWNNLINQIELHPNYFVPFIVWTCTKEVYTQIEWETSTVGAADGLLILHLLQ